MGSIDWLPIEEFDGREQPVLLWVTYVSIAAEPVTARWVGSGAWKLIQSGAGSENDSVWGTPTHWAPIEAPTSAAAPTFTGVDVLDRDRAELGTILDLGGGRKWLSLGTYPGPGKS